MKPLVWSASFRQGFLFFSKMKKLSPKQKSGAIALLGVIALIGLEYHISPDQGIMVMIAICFVGIGRLYLFTEGATMENPIHRDIAYKFSIGLTIGFFIYVIIIYVTRPEESIFKSYHLALFIISTLTLLAVEWVFGKRTGYKRINAISIRDNQAKRLIAIARDYSKKLEYLRKRIGSIESELDGKTLQIDTLKGKIEDLEARPDFSQFADYWLIEGNSRFRVSKCCGAKSVLPSNASKSLNCSNCGKEIWNKELVEK